MAKSFTCRELMGICDERISGDSFMEIVEKGMAHMQSDDAHRQHMAQLATVHTEEDRKKWFEEMREAFDARANDE